MAKRASLRSPGAGGTAPLRLVLLVALASGFTADSRVAQAQSAIPEPDRIELRGEALPLAGRISGVGDGGVTIVDASGRSQAVSWDRIRAVDSQQWRRDIDRRMPTATDLWRARTRIERGDTELAEPLLEAHVDLMRSGRSETALVVAEGLLRCRLARGEHALAIEPAIITASLRRSGASTGAYVGLPPVIDPLTGLAPQLPPVLIDGPGVATLRSTLEAIIGGDDPIAAEVASLYRAALIVEDDGALRSPGELPAPRPGAPGDPGAALLRALLAALQPDSAARGEARSRLTGSSSHLPALARPWAGAWASFFVGASSLQETESESRLRGIVSMLRIPAEAGPRRPWLAGLALVIAARALAEEGDATGAARLRREYETDHPYHPFGPLGSPGPSGPPGPRSAADAHDPHRDSAAMTA